MILPFSNYFPWTEKGGGKIPTYLPQSVQNGKKIHSFRGGKRWREGMQIDMYSGAPYSKGGHLINPPLAIVVGWKDLRRDLVVCEPGKTITPILRGNPNPDFFRPLVHGVENFTFQRIEDGKDTILTLKIDGVYIFEAKVFGIYDAYKVKEGTEEKALEIVAENDGLSVVDFLKWFRHSMRKAEVKTLEGQIIHWTPFRYVASTGATITDSI